MLCRSSLSNSCNVFLKINIDIKNKVKIDRVLALLEALCLIPTKGLQYCNFSKHVPLS